MIDICQHFHISENQYMCTHKPWLQWELAEPISMTTPAGKQTKLKLTQSLLNELSLLSFLSNMSMESTHISLLKM